MSPPVVLDFDQSVGALPAATVIDLRAQQDAIRFGCGTSHLRALSSLLDTQLPAQYGTVFLGSGDFHHVSCPLIERHSVRRPFQVVVLDNHPDNMRFPFGVHCGSWVRRVALLPFVSRVHVLGITSSDVSTAHAWENYLTPLRQGKLNYWCIGIDTRWAKGVIGRMLGVAGAFREFDSITAMIDRFASEFRASPQPTYLSIDKDVLASDVARTNWDQGCMSEAEMNSVIDLLAGNMIGSDITGDVSIHHYRQWWKRKLSAFDEQPQIAPAQLAEWQAQQHQLNLRILDRMGNACG